MARRKREVPHVFKRLIRQGVLFVTADSKNDADRQAQAFERDAQRHWVRQQAEIKPGVFALGSKAKVQLGLEIYKPYRIRKPTLLMLEMGV